MFIEQPKCYEISDVKNLNKLTIQFSLNSKYQRLTFTKIITALLTNFENSKMQVLKHFFIHLFNSLLILNNIFK